MFHIYNISFFNYILLVVLLQLSHFFLTSIPLHPAPPLPPVFLPHPLVHVHGSYIQVLWLILYKIGSYTHKCTSLIFYIVFFQKYLDNNALVPWESSFFMNGRFWVYFPQSCTHVMFSVFCGSFFHRYPHNLFSQFPIWE